MSYNPLINKQIYTYFYKNKKIKNKSHIENQSHCVPIEPHAHITTTKIKYFNPKKILSHKLTETNLASDNIQFKAFYFRFFLGKQTKDSMKRKALLA